MKEIDKVHTLKKATKVWKCSEGFASLLVCMFEIRYKLIVIDFGRWFRSYAETLYKSCVVTEVQEPKD